MKTNWTRIKSSLRYVLISMVFFLPVGGTASAQELTLPFTFSSGNVISSYEMNENFAALADKANALDSVIGSLSETGSIWTYNAGTLSYTSGSVGVGTDSPVSLFTVAKEDGLSSGAHILSTVYRGDGSGQNAGVSLGYIADGTNQTGGYIRAEDSLPLVFGSPIYVEGGMVRISSGSDVSGSSGGFLQTGSTSGFNIGIDDNEIQARNSGSPNQLLMQTEGGHFKVHSGVSGAEFFVYDSGNTSIGAQSDSAKLLIKVPDNDAGINDSFVVTTGLSSGAMELRVGVSDTNEYVWLEATERLVSPNRNLVLNGSGGNVGIGTTSPSFQLDVAGTVSCTSLNETSDGRYKTDIVTIPNALSRLQQLRGVNFNWINTERFGSGRQLGIVAQEIEKVFPETVHTDAAGNKSVTYTKLTAVLIEAVKEQQVMIEELQQRISELEGP